MASSCIANVFKGQCDYLGAHEATGTWDLNVSLSKYKYLLIHLYRRGDGTTSVEATGFIDMDTFKLYTTVPHAFGTNSYNDSQRNYGYLSYYGDRQLYVQVSTMRGVAIFGIY